MMYCLKGTVDVEGYADILRVTSPLAIIAKVTAFVKSRPLS